MIKRGVEEVFLWNYYKSDILLPKEFILILGVFFVVVVIWAVYLDRKERRKDDVCNNCRHYKQCVMEMKCSRFKPKDDQDLDRHETRFKYVENGLGMERMRLR